MAKILYKLDDGQEVFEHELKDVVVKSVGDYEIEMIGTTEAVDRDGDVISLDGWDMKNYKKNPVVLPSHNYGSPAIGRTTKLKREGNKLIFRIEFPQEGIYPLADIYRKLYKSGFMNASSVGFIPKDYTLGDGSKDSPRRTFLKQELLEISLVSVPSNPEALLEAKEMGVGKGSLKSAEELGVVNKDEYDKWLEAVKDVLGGLEEDTKEVKKEEVKQTEKAEERTSEEIKEQEKKDLIDLIESNWDYFKEVVLNILKELSAEKYIKTILSGEGDARPKPNPSEEMDKAIEAVKQTFKERNLV